MTLTIEIPDAQAAALKAKAEAQGLTIESWFQQIAQDFAPSDSFVHLQWTNPKEWARRFHEWAESHDPNIPVLSDWAMSRDSIYLD